MKDDKKPEMSEGSKKTRRRETITFYLLISPWIIGFLWFIVGPMIISFWMSLHRWDLLTDPVFIGFDNYVRAFTNDPLFYQSLRVTFTFAFASVPLGLVVSLMVALLLNQVKTGLRIFRTIYYIPVVVSGIAVMVLWMFIFNPHIGLLNQFLALFGIDGPGWIFDDRWALPSLVFMSLWNIGGTVIIWLAGLMGVSDSLYEAADLDGASRFQKFWYVTVPSISPTIFFNLIMGIIGSLQAFGQAFVMTGGGPRNSTLLFNFYLWRHAFGDFRMGYASALAWVLFAIILVFTLFTFKSSSMWVYYESERK